MAESPVRLGPRARERLGYLALGFLLCLGLVTARPEIVLGPPRGVAMAALPSLLDPPPTATRPAEDSHPRKPDARHEPSIPSPVTPPANEGDALFATPDLGAKVLVVPVLGAGAADLRDSFDEGRVGHRHEAIDIMAPRNTPVVAVEAGTIAKLFTSVPGGLTIYQFDPTTTYAYYYAHLDAYAPNIVQGGRITAGQVIGYVGTTGNAPPDAPHLHFAIYRLGATKRWWEGSAINPYPVLRAAALR